MHSLLSQSITFSSLVNRTRLTRVELNRSTTSCPQEACAIACDFRLEGKASACRSSFETYTPKASAAAKKKAKTDAKPKAKPIKKAVSGSSAANPAAKKTPQWDFFMTACTRSWKPEEYNLLWHKVTPAQQEALQAFHDERDATIDDPRCKICVRTGPETHQIFTYVTQGEQ